jgi:hypothetical protein
MASSRWISSSDCSPSSGGSAYACSGNLHERIELSNGQAGIELRRYSYSHDSHSRSFSSFFILR